MKVIALAIGLAIGLGTGCRAKAPPETPSAPVTWSVTAATDVSEVQVGDDLHLTVTVEHPPGEDFIPPPEKDFEPFTVLETGEEEVSPEEKELHYRLAAYRLPGDIEIPALTLRYRDGTGEMVSLETEAIPVRLVTSLTPDVTEIHDIKDSVSLEVPRDWSLLWWIVGALLLAVLRYIIRKKLRERAQAKATPIPPPPPPDVEAEAALRRLLEKKLIERGELALFYTELTDIMKRYAGRRFGVPYLERTTHEILADLRVEAPARDCADGLSPILETADLVKFAKQMPASDEAANALSKARQLVHATRPVLEPQEATP